MSEPQKLNLRNISINSIPQPIWILGLDGQILEQNNAAEKINLNQKDNTIFSIFPIITDEYLSKIDKSIGSTLEVNYNQQHFHLTIMPESDSYLIIATDVTDYKLTERRLNESKSFLRKVIDTDPNLIFVKDAAGRFVLANKQVAKVYGTTTTAIIGKTDADFNEHPDEVNVFVTDDQFVINHKQDLIIKEEKVTTADQDEIWLETVKLPIQTIDGGTQVLGIATDITKKKKLQEQLMHSQKMEAVGQLAGGIAHDFNNLLTGIMGYTSMLLSAESIDPQIAHAAEMIQSAADKAANLTQQLLAFARKGKHQNTPVDLHQIIIETVSLLSRTFERNVNLKQDLLAKDSLIMGDPVQLQQVILNLAINARDAMNPERKGSNGGELKIKTELKHLNHVAANDLNLKEGDYIRLTVTDSGCGIAPQDLGKIFDPFFSTKSPEHGSGMGLAMVYGIVTSHEGAIKVTSQLGAGTEVRVYLPMVKAKISAVTVDKLKRTQPGRGHILLVDDHSLIREVTTKMLTSLGYDVVTAKDGVEALQYYRHNSNAVDLIILDMVMPRMGAKECFKEFKTINPGVRAVLSTGYVNNHIVQNIMNEGMVGFVQKPYHLNSLSRVISEALRQ